MRELRMLGSVRGALSNGRPYRDQLPLQGAMGDALHALSFAAGYNIRWLLRAIVRLGLGGLFYAFSAVAACLASLMQILPTQTKLAKPAPSPRRRPSSNLPWLALAGLK